MRFAPIPAVTGGAAAVAYLAGVASDHALLRQALKPVPLLCLAAWVARAGVGPARRPVLVGLLLSAVGDVLLDRGESGFLAGLVAFLLAHLAYVAAFVSEQPALRFGRALPFMAYGLGAYLFLRPSLGQMTVPVGLYVLAIVTMMWRAAARIDAGHARAWYGVVGAVLFGLSDTLIALDRFHAPIAGVQYPIMLLYWAGQAGIALSTLPDGRRSGGH